MSRRFACPRGHVWYADIPSSAGDTTRMLPICPSCGKVGEHYTARLTDNDRDEAPTSRIHSEALVIRDERSPGPELAGAPPELPGYELQGEIGRGGMGVVYSALDVVHRGRVAIKHLPRIDPAKILRFKQEFRALSGVHHPNLAGVYELIQRDGHWFIVMERVEGAAFVDHFLGIADYRQRLQRLRPALVQLVEGLHFLHQAGLVHCDIKPSNVLVADDGRVVLLDFGLVAQQSGVQAPGDLGAELVGSLGYLAPERYAGKPPSAATDWYSVGVMIFEVLVGQRPFHGPRTSLIWQQRYLAPPAPVDVLSTVPAEWNALCMSLMHREPTQRPDGPALLAWLRTGAGPPSLVAAPPMRDAPLIGRDRHLADLNNAFALSRTGRTVVARIRGRSGMGKSTLIERFLERLAVREPVVIIRGSCYQQESVPYKGLDSLIDALSRYLSGLNDTELNAVLPADLGSLCRAFPVLRRVKAAAAWKSPQASDPLELRRQAFESLRELFLRLGKLHPLVLVLDDLQWADEDSARVLADLVRPPDAPRLLLVLGSRTEDETASPCLRRLHDAWPTGEADPTVIEMDVEALTPLEASSLALALLTDSEAATEPVAERIAREAQGWPLYVHELARYFRESTAPTAVSGASELSLDRVIGERLARTSASARQILDLVAVAGQALRLEDVVQAADLGAGARTAVASLRAGLWLRSIGDEANQAFECYHDCVREAVLRRLTPEVRAACHDRLARAFAATHARDYVLLAVHTLGAGRAEEAAEHYWHAAEEAEQALAFERAAQLHRVSLDLAPPPENLASGRWRRLADALAYAGRAPEAAEAYVAACRGADRTAIRQLRRQAAYQQCISGNIDQGIATLCELLRAAGQPCPTNPTRMLWALGWERLRLRWRGLGFKSRELGEISADELEQVELGWSTAAGLSLIDLVAGAYFQARHLRQALDLGEPARLARALAWEAAQRAAAGLAGQEHARTYLNLARDLGLNAGPVVRAIVTLAEGVVHYSAGRWLPAREALTKTQASFRQFGGGSAWERNTTEVFHLWTLFQLGRFVELKTVTERHLKEVRDRGDRLATINLGTYAVPLCCLANDQPAKAREQLHAHLADWPRSRGTLQHATALANEVRIDLYEGNASTAWDRLCQEWPVLTAARLLRVGPVRIMLRQLRVNAALALLQKSPTAALHRSIQRDVRDLMAEGMNWPAALAARANAGLAELAGQTSIAHETWRRAAKDFDDLAMPVHAAGIRLRLGDSDAANVIRAHGIANPERWTAMEMPGTLK